MEGLTKLVSRRKSFTDKKSESSTDSSAAVSAKVNLGRFRLKIRMLSTMKVSRALQRPLTTVAYENTYKMEPEKDNIFSTQRAEQVIQDVFEHYLRGKAYDPSVFSRLIKTLTELIRERVKMQGLDRYKIIATVTAIQNKHQGIQLASRALWNHNSDNYASLAYEGSNYYVVGSVYVVYCD